ncbi:MAG: response regulator [Deltaproteobacteria bacterium]|nr:response regulator [Deltaproteobacteria bacterium]
MKKEALRGKEILAVDDEPDVLEVLEEELSEYGVIMDKALSFEEAIRKLSSLTYDLVILDIMGVQGFDLLKFAVNKKLPVLMLTAHAISPEALKRSVELGARAYLPKDKLGQLAPFLQNVLELSYQSAWRNTLEHLAAYFGQRFGPDWRKSEHEFWEKFEKDLEVQDSIIIRS